jgi:hypothetical protein
LDIAHLSQTLAGKNREIEEATAKMVRIRVEADRKIQLQDKFNEGVAQRLSQTIHNMEVGNSFLVEEMRKKEYDFTERCKALNEEKMLMIQKADERDSFLKKVLCFSVKMKWRVLSERAIRMEDNRSRHEDFLFAMKDVMKPKILRIKNKLLENERKIESLLKTFNERSKISLIVRDQSEHFNKTSFDIMEILANQSQSIQHRYLQKKASSFPHLDVTSTSSADQQLACQSPSYNG